MRVLIPGGSGSGDPWVVGERVGLDQDEIHHLRVRRAKDRDLVEILDGAGLRGLGLLIQAGRNWEVEFQSVERQERPPETTIAVAAGDRERFAWMVEKAVELGVTCIVPLETARSAGVATRLKDAHVNRLRRSALESIKQCGLTWAPSVEEPVSLTDFLAKPLRGCGWLADTAGAPAPAQLDLSAMTVVVGPEGGLTDDERAAAMTAGYQPVVLGPHILRFETAALAAATAVTQARMRGRHG
jgi:16S rRNA (uracil1498-N3)-methyltransferase